jgi:hypothetical protein
MRPLLLVAAGGILVVGLAARLLTAANGGAGVTLPAFPTSWNIERYAGNPVIDVDNNPNETTEQYTPAPIRLPGGDIWVYVKGLDRIYAWKSTDDGETFALQNSNNAVITPGSGWESEFTVDPAAVYDPATDTIHLYYKGTNDAQGDAAWGWGHATADGDTPTSFTKDLGNPILTSATVSTALGGGAVTDMSLSDVVKIGSTFHFYGYTNEAGVYQIIQATGSTWNDPTGVESILSAAGGAETVVQCPSVFIVDGRYGMFYSRGGALPGNRTIRVAESLDAETWDFSDTTDIISPTGTGWEEDDTYVPSILKTGVGPVPVTIDGKWLLYYSGYESPPGDANVGLAYLEPS